MPVWSHERRRVPGRFTRRLLIALSLIGLGSETLAACPAFLLGRHLPFLNRDRVIRDSLALFRFDKGRFEAITMQLDPLDEEGALLFPKEADWRTKPMSFSDRLSFYVKDFGSVYDGRSALPCKARELVSFEYQGRFAYLMDCGKNAAVEALRPLTHEPKTRTVKTSDYQYRYSADNHLVFESIELKTPSGLTSVASNADLFIVGDVKNFFTLTFDSSDIDAAIVHERQGPMGLMGGMEFFLRILAFKINMELLPEVNFFQDSLFMPMSMTIPVDARKYLRRGSGIYYSWTAAPDVEWQWDQSALDELDPGQLNPNTKLPPVRPSLKYCNYRQCHYTIKGLAKGRPFVLNFRIARKTAELGFFPQLIRDVPLVEKTIDRKISTFPAEQRTAIYFETARLPKGTHTWDFWIYFPDEGAPDSCQYRIKRENLMLREKAG